MGPWSRVSRHGMASGIRTRLGSGVHGDIEGVGAAMVYSATVKESVQPWCAQRQQRGRYGYGELMGEVPVVGEGGVRSGGERTGALDPTLVGPTPVSHTSRLWRARRQRRGWHSLSVPSDSKGVGTAMVCSAVEMWFTTE